MIVASPLFFLYFPPPKDLPYFLFAIPATGFCFNVSRGLWGRGFTIYYGVSKICVNISRAIDRVSPEGSAEYVAGV